jgi:hypothetical protein
MSRLSLRAAIDAMCKSCIYDPGSGNGAWREQVAGCSSSNCPLHSVRPLPVKARNPAAEPQSGGPLLIGAADQEQAILARKIGRNDDAADERRAA